MFDDEETSDSWAYAEEWDEADSEPLKSPNLEDGTAKLVIEHKYSIARGFASTCPDPLPTLGHNHQKT